MNSPAAGEPEHMRASDADRESVAEVLRQAAGDGRLTLEELDERLDAAYAAKTYAELAPVTRDLPTAGPGHVPAPAPDPGPVSCSNPARFGGVPGPPAAVAILGGFTRKGDWVVPKEFTAFTLLGGGEIDLREARFEERSVTLHVVAILGGVEITVPDDATVHVNGVGVMGGFDHHATGAGAPGGPVITVNGVALMGGVEVKRRSPRKNRPDRYDRQDRLERRAARLDRRAERLERRTGELE